jgi:hypothetical protein
MNQETRQDIFTMAAALACAISSTLVHFYTTFCASLPARIRFGLWQRIRRARRNALHNTFCGSALGTEHSVSLYRGASLVYTPRMEKPWAVLDTSFWVVGHWVDVLTHLFRFFTVCVPDAVRTEVLAPDPRYPHPVYDYRELFRLQYWPSMVEKGERSCRGKRAHPSPQNG